MGNPRLRPPPRLIPLMDTTVSTLGLQLMDTEFLPLVTDAAEKGQLNLTMADTTDTVIPLVLLDTLEPLPPLLPEAPKVSVERGLLKPSPITDMEVMDTDTDMACPLDMPTLDITTARDPLRPNPTMDMV